MMKITTEKCVDYICGLRGGRHQDWKLLSKSKHENGSVVREFENLNLGMKLDLFEYRGGLYIDNPRKGYGWLFAIVENDNSKFGIWTTPKAYWESHHRVDDTHMSDVGLKRDLEMYWLSEEMENYWEHNGNLTKEQVRNVFIGLGFANDPKFQAFCEDPVRSTADEDEIDENIWEETENHE